MTAAGRALLPAQCVTIAATWGWVRRLSVRWVRDERGPHGGRNSGRAVPSRQSRAVGSWSSTRPSSSSVEGSAQCRSSHTASTGCRAVSASNQATRASSVCCRCGLRLRGAERSASGTASGAAKGGTASSRATLEARNICASWSPGAPGVASLPNWRRRSRCASTGYRALLV